MEDSTILSQQTIQSSLEDSKLLKNERLNTTLFFTSKCISLLGTNVYNFALSLYILKITGSGISFALNVLMGMVPRIIFGPLAGIVADRINRKKLTILLDVFSGVVVFGLLLAASLFGLKVGFIYAAAVFLSILNVFYDTSLGAALPNLVRDNQLMKVNAYAGAAGSLSGILSPVIGGLIYGWIPINIFLIINGVSFFFSAFQELFINFDLNKQEVLEGSASAPVQSMGSAMKEVLGFIKEQKVLSYLFKYALMINFFITAAMAVVYPFIINRVLKMKPSQFGTIEAFFSAGFLVTSLIIGHLKEKEKKMKIISFGLAAIGAILILIGVPTLNFFSHLGINLLFIYYILLLFTTAALLVLVNTPLMVTIQRITPDQMRGRINGMLGTLCSGIAPFGVIIAGIIIEIVPPFIILAVSGVITIAAALFILWNKTLMNF